MSTIPNPCTTNASRQPPATGTRYARRILGRYLGVERRPRFLYETLTGSWKLATDRMAIITSLVAEGQGHTSMSMDTHTVFLSACTRMLLDFYELHLAWTLICEDLEQCENAAPSQNQDKEGHSQKVGASQQESASQQEDDSQLEDDSQKYADALLMLNTTRKHFMDTAISDLRMKTALSSELSKYYTFSIEMSCENRLVPVLKESNEKIPIILQMMEILKNEKKRELFGARTARTLSYINCCFGRNLCSFCLFRRRRQSRPGVRVRDA